MAEDAEHDDKFARLGQGPKKKHVVMDFLGQLEKALLQMAGMGRSQPDDHDSDVGAGSDDCHPREFMSSNDPGKFGNDQTIQRLKIPDVNGLLGRSYRNPITGQVCLKEVESWRDFSLVDAWTHQILIATPAEHAENPYLFRPRPLNMRTFLYHSKFRQAKAEFRIGGMEEAFVTEALNERCVDMPGTGGLWSPVMVYFPLIPLTLLADDFVVFALAAFVNLFTLLVSISTSTHRFYFWGRLISLPARLVFLFVALARIQGGGLQLLGYAITVIGALVDIGFGDLQLLLRMKHQCSYQITKTLPNQVFVCSRTGHADATLEDDRKPLPEKLTGVKDSGDGMVRLIANVQGLLVELVPVQAKVDGEMFAVEHEQRAQFPHLGNLKFLGLDLLSPEFKTVQDMFAKNDSFSNLQKLIKGGHRKDEQLMVEDV